MSQIQSGTLEKLQDLIPDQIGDNRRWSTTLVNNLIMLAARAAWERIGFQHGEQEIDLVDDEPEYDLDPKFITVTRVEFASVGPEGPAPYDYDYYVDGGSFEDFDRVSRVWRVDRGVRPELYTLLSAPGSPNAKIHFYPALANATGLRIRVTGMVTAPLASETTQQVHDDVQDKFLVPYTTGLLYAREDPSYAAEQFAEAEQGGMELRGRYADEYPTGRSRNHARAYYSGQGW